MNIFQSLVIALCLMQTRMLNGLLNTNEPSPKVKLDLTVEILICTDYSVYKMHHSILALNSTQVSKISVLNHIKAYYTEIINQVNGRYQSSFSDDPDLNIRLEISEFYIAEKPEDSKWFSENKFWNNKVNGDLSLVQFNTWLEDNRKRFAEFDHAFGITASDLTSRDQAYDYNGLAYIYGICKQFYSGSIIEDKGAFESTRSFAHELSHNLGTDHDGLSPNKACSEWDNFIMSSKYLPYNQMNSWFLSNCSVKSIKDYLSDPQNNYCLLNRPNNRKLGEENYKFKLYPGQIYNLYDQCRQLYGPLSTPCFKYETSFCQSLYCQKNMTDSECYWISPASEGSDCGNEGWCIMGQCVDKATNPKHDKVEKEKSLFKKNDSEEEDCRDIMDDEFCQVAFLNNYCNEMFYWNGKSIGNELCKQKCKKCV